MPRLLLAGMTVVLVSAPTSDAAAQFGRVRTVAAHGLPTLSGPPSVAVGPSGEWAIAWIGAAGRYGGRLLVRRGSSPSRLNRNEALARGGLSDAEVAVAPDGTTAVVWQRLAPRGGRRYVLAAVARRGRGFGRPQKLVSVKAIVAGQHVVAVGGRVVVAWGQGVPGGGHEIRYAIAGSRGRFAATRTLARAYIVADSDIAADEKGNVVVGYRTPLSAKANAQLAAAVLPRQARRFNASQIVSADTQRSFPDSEADGAQLFSGPGGVAAGYGVQGVLPWRLQVARLGPDLTFGPPRTVGEVGNPPPNNAGFTGPVVALPAQGPLLAAWSPFETGCGECETPVNGELDATLQQPDGTFTAPFRITNKVAQYPIAAATTRTAILVWGEGAFDDERLRYALHLEDGSFTPPRTLANHVLRDAAISGAGTRAVVAWISRHALRAAWLTDSRP